MPATINVAAMMHLANNTLITATPAVKLQNIGDGFLAITPATKPTAPPMPHAKMPSSREVIATTMTQTILQTPATIPAVTNPPMERPRELFVVGSVGCREGLDCVGAVNGLTEFDGWVTAALAFGTVGKGLLAGKGDLVEVN